MKKIVEIKIIAELLTENLAETSKEIDLHFADVVNDTGGEVIDIKEYREDVPCVHCDVADEDGEAITHNNSIDVYIAKGGYLTVYNSDWIDNVSVKISTCPVCGHTI